MMEAYRDNQSQQASLLVRSCDVCAGNEINLIELWHVLRRQWKVIGAVVSLAIFLAVCYLFQITPVYESKAFVKPPESKDVEILNIPDVQHVNRDNVFVQFTGNLSSQLLRRQFIDENQRFSSILGNELKVIRENLKDEPSLLSLRLQGHDPKLIADWVNGFILFVDKKTIDDIVSTAEISTNNQKNAIENQLRVGLSIAYQRRLDRISQLDDHISLASDLKMFDGQLYLPSMEESKNVGALSINPEQYPLYMRGVKALVAEKELLEKRKNDEPYIERFRDRQAALAQLDAGLKQLQAAKGHARTVVVDQQAVPSISPVGTRWIFVLFKSAFAGIIVGAFTAFVCNLVLEKKMQTRKPQ